MSREKPLSFKFILPILMILLLSIAGCASNPSNPSKPSNPEISSGGSTSPAPGISQNATPGSSTATGAETKAGVVTYENYLKIKLDTTYDDVKNILGEGKKKQSMPTLSGTPGQTKRKKS
ncbi:hypothetical protein [Desulfosporosinus sp. OT]|uniref:hypothetical protein n=1 Tax=Desulfosporosinus sp. OT TaxID=913865 RepID=UPI0002239BD6|nr:hypothetical protein [Desulfosporosinus sp. OT]EGW37357.1 putative lipoprotein [Desulfosporosinus sp. OT]